MSTTSCQRARSSQEAPTPLSLAGSNWPERNSLIAQTADVFIVIEGGPGAAGEATEAFMRTTTSESVSQGPLLLCVRWTGGAARGMSFPGSDCCIPRGAFLQHRIATDAEWKSLEDPSKRERAPSAIADMIERFLDEKALEPHRDAKRRRTE